MAHRGRRIFPPAALRFFVGVLAVLLGTAFCAELWLRHQSGATLMSRSWGQEDTRIKQNNLTKLAGLDETFPLMATPGGIRPMQGGKSHRIVVIADSFSWGDGLANINDVWWRQIERELERRGYTDVEVLALGWNGAQTKEELAWLRDPRFAGLKPLTATLTVDTTQAKAISNHLIGIFFEDINYAADGGLYAELVQNRDFEYSPRDGSREKWDSGYAWTVREGEHTTAPAIGTEQPLHPNNPHYAILQVNTPGTSLENSGYDGIALKQGARYDFSCRARIAPGSRGGKATVSLRTPEGRQLASARISITADEWKQLRATLTPSEDATRAVLCITPDEPGSYHFDLVSLFPRDTFKGRKNGLRADLAQVLADLHPRFVRFPGGCVAHGDGIDNIYDWKGSIGPLEARKPLRNLWGYHQTRGLGYHEYFLFCEDIGAEPLPVVAAGVPCQNSGTCSHHADSELGCNGQQGGIPQEEMPAYIQDVLDLIEYANGDARKTVWGRKRAEAGHSKPFGLKYIGIGNEDLITSVFEERFTQIYRAVRERYPDITVIGTVGPFYEGTDYNEGWKLATRLGVPMVDEHYYVQPGWFIHNQNFYDRYDRSKPQVYLGEYAAHLPGRPSNLEVALAEALYLTAVERNADVVRMADLYNRGAVNRLREAFPGWTERNHDFAALVIAGFSPQEICVMLGMTPNGVYTLKSKLKRRIAESDIAAREELLRFFA